MVQRSTLLICLSLTLMSCQQPKTAEDFDKDPPKALKLYGECAQAMKKNEAMSDTKMETCMAVLKWGYDRYGLDSANVPD